MKKIIIVSLCMVFWLAMILPSFGEVGLSVVAVQEKKVPARNATLNKKGELEFGKSATAYSPDSWDMILKAYGGILPTDVKIPASYATLNKKGTFDFVKSATAFSPDVTNEILKSYGFIPTEATYKLKDPATYAKLNKKGEPEFGKSPTAYSPKEFDMLMKTYQLAGAITEKKDVKTTPTGACCINEKCSVRTEEECKAAGGTWKGAGTECKADTCKITPQIQEDKPVVKDKCPDEDGDGICDDKDKCPGTPKGAHVDERGCWVIEGLLFDFDKAIIKTKYYPNLDDVVRVMKENPDLKVQISGHTCSIGTDKYNQKLSEKRAKAVFEYLTKKGIDAKRLTWKGYGEKNPAFPNKTKENRSKNRRVELEPKR